jgi:hypothetical protein
MIYNKKELIEILEKFNDVIIDYVAFRGFYISIKQGSYYLYNDGSVRRGYGSSLGGGFWETKELAEEFYEVWNGTKVVEKKYIIHPGFVEINEQKIYIICDVIILHHELDTNECLKDYGERSLNKLDQTKFIHYYATKEMVKFKN